MLLSSRVVLLLLPQCLLLLTSRAASPFSSVSLASIEGFSFCSSLCSPSPCHYHKLLRASVRSKNPTHQPDSAAWFWPTLRVSVGLMSYSDESPQKQHCFTDESVICPGLRLLCFSVNWMPSEIGLPVCESSTIQDCLNKTENIDAIMPFNWVLNCLISFCLL